MILYESKVYIKVVICSLNMSFILSNYYDRRIILIQHLSTPPLPSHLSFFFTHPLSM